MNGYRLLEHTADMGIEATGEDLATLFEQAALGLREVITGCTDIDAQVEIAVEVSADDLELLLINWLSEVLYLFEIRNLLPADIVIDEIGETRLRARVRGEPVDPRRHPIDREVKAVTYHQLLVKQTEKGWRARVYLDL